MVRLLLLLVAISLCVFEASSSCTAGGNDASIYPVDYTTSQSGQATYYGVYTNGGACTLDPTPPAGTDPSIWSTVAIADNVWSGSKACGMCISITFLGSGSGASHPTGTHTVFVNNECPSCASNGIDLGQSGDGVWDMTWKAVPCPVTTAIQFFFQGTNLYYIKLQIRNSRYPVYGVSVLQNGVYHALVRTADNFFTAGSTVTFPLTFPLPVQITSSTGDVITDSIPSLTNSVALPGTAQFPDCSVSSNSSATTAAATTAAATTAAATTTAKASTTTTTTAKASTTTTTTAKASTTTTTTAKASTTTTTTAKASTTTTTTAKSTTTGASSTTGTSGTKTYVYQDAVNTAMFSDWSWGTENPQVTSPVYAGTYSYGFTPVSYDGAYFRCATAGCINPSTIASVICHIYSPYALTNQINFALVQNSAAVNQQPLSTYITSGVPANTWTLVTIPLNGFATGAYDGLWFQEAAGQTLQQIFLDEIMIVSK